MSSVARAAGNALHTPVLVERCIDLLAPALNSDNAVLIDCTLGMGGHTQAFLEHFPHLTVIGIDRDTQALELSKERLAAFGDRVRYVHATYDHVKDVADEYGNDGTVHGVFMDLGVSSLQLDDTERGFSYANDAPLDMRMDATSGQSAHVILNNASVQELTRILRDYGEERFASRIAKDIVAQRAHTPLTRTSQLVDIVKGAIPAPARRTGGNPAKRTFQALRIAVNDELNVLKRAIHRAVESLDVGGRIVVESYQSLEDKIVKSAFAQGATSSTPLGLPVELAGHEPYIKLLTRGAEKADMEEQEKNSRSASVRLRGAEKLREGWISWQ